jgi:teichoic acid transport system permease protein
MTSRSSNRAVRYASELWARREFGVQLALSSLKARNASTGLGLAWWVLNPLLLAAVYFLVFGIIFGNRRPDGFLGYLLAGIFPFYFTSTSMTGSVNKIIGNAKLLVNVRFPRLILPMSAVFEALVGFGASLIVLYGIGIPTGQLQGFPALWLLPPVVGLHIVFNLGLGAAVARLAVPFRDLNNLIPYLNRLWLYVTPIIWPIALLDDQAEWVRTMVWLNPLTPFVSLYRSGLLGYPADPEALWLVAGWSIIVGLLGVGWFVRDEGHMVRYL